MSYSNVQDAPASNPWSRFRFILLDIVVFSTLVIVPSTLIFTPKDQWKSRVATVLRGPAHCMGRLMLLTAFEIALRSFGTEMIILYHASFHSIESARACATDLRNAGTSVGFPRAHAGDTLDCFYPFLRHWKSFIVPDVNLLCRRVLGEPSLCAGFRFEHMLAMLNRSSVWISTSMHVADLVGLLAVMIAFMDAPVNATWFARVRQLPSTLWNRAEVQTYVGMMSVRVVVLYVETLVQFRLIRLSIGLSDSFFSTGPSRQYQPLQGAATLMRTSFGVLLFLVETVVAIVAERAVLGHLSAAPADQGNASWWRRDCWLVRECAWAAVSVLMFPWANPVIRADVEAIFDLFVGRWG
jgi:hypothetical protein